MSVDIEKLCQTWYKEHGSDQMDSSNNPSINLERLKITAHDTRWKTTLQPCTAQGPTRRVRVLNSTKSEEVFGTLKTSKESVLKTEVSFSEGYVKGLTTTLRLPAPPEIQSFVGQYVNIDLSKQISEHSDTMNLCMTSGHDIPPGACSSASVTSEIREYEGDFECTAVMKGLVTFRARNGIIQEEIHNILSQNGNGAVHFKVKGHCHFQWDFEQTIEWKKN